MKASITDIKVLRITDEWPDLTWLGEFSMESGIGAIDLWERHGHRRDTHHYFNPADPDHAEEDLVYLEGYFRGNFCFKGVRAVATVTFEMLGGSLDSKIETPGIWGYDSNDNSAMNEAAECELETLRDMAHALGLHWPNNMASRALANPVEE